MIMFIYYRLQIITQTLLTFSTELECSFNKMLTSETADEFGIVTVVVVSIGNPTGRYS